MPAASAVAIVLLTLAVAAQAVEPQPSHPAAAGPADPLFRAVDLNVGESAEVKLADGKTVTVKVLELKEHRCEMRNAVRRAAVTVEVAGRRAELISATYHLPKTVGQVQIDCPVTKGYVSSRSQELDMWALDKDVRLRLWPAGSSWAAPGTFAMPVNQRWFASDTQMANDPCYTNACDTPGQSKVYYHYGLDFGGAEGLVDVLAATDGVVVSKAGQTAPGDHPPQVKGRYDVVYLRDARGWYYRYSHMMRIEEDLKVGNRIKQGTKIGTLGKEGGSGGWSHLHFDISMPQPSGRYGIADGYAFLFEAYCRAHRPAVIAVARPHLVAWAGQPVALDATRSWHADGPAHIRGYEWRFTDGTAGAGPTVQRTYEKPGHYTETLKVTDDAGRFDYDFAVVQVFDKAKPLPMPPAIHAAFWPTEGIRAGDEVAFKVRTFAVKPDEGRETWDFGDGSPAVHTQSDGNIKQLAKDGYAVTSHRYAKPGHYLVSVSRPNDRGQTATARLHVEVRARESTPDATGGGQRMEWWQRQPFLREGGLRPSVGQPAGG